MVVRGAPFSGKPGDRSGRRAECRSSVGEVNAEGTLAADHCVWLAGPYGVSGARRPMWVISGVVEDHVNEEEEHEEQEKATTKKRRSMVAFAHHRVPVLCGGSTLGSQLYYQFADGEHIDVAVVVDVFVDVPLGCRSVCCTTYS